MGTKQVVWTTSQRKFLSHETKENVCHSRKTDLKMGDSENKNKREMKNLTKKRV